MFMKCFIGLLFLSLLSCSCSQFPSGDLKELIIFGEYYPEDPRRLEEAKKRWRKHLKEGETIEEKHSNFLDREIDKEHFKHIQEIYCYNERKNKKPPMFKKTLRVRTTDKKGNVLFEDFVRLASPDKFDEEGKYTESYLKIANEHRSDLTTPEEGLLDTSRFIYAYVPYNKKATSIVIFRLEGDKEVVLRGYPIDSLSEVKRAVKDPLNIGWKFRTEDQCYSNLAH